MSHASYPRAARVREAIKEVLASEIERLKDPGIGFVTITEVTMSPDLRNAKAFYTVYGSDVDRAATKDGLKRATKHLRTAVAHEIRLRFAPTLEFVEDPVPGRTERIEQILADIARKGAGDESGSS
jgi:ribosome-binding factor A